ncbi:MAG: hypothetical protein CVT66_06300 [Actinobacteria bacterium HGW-Actinobacteria-6]|nr:MAG: hypothetical protein CVT66_06300 [Actinobacteria bacterium HGW-Actinobacteria-6]
MNVWKAQARTAYAAGSLEVRRQGESANRKVSMGRHCSGAQAGDWVLVGEQDGVCWGLALLGTGPTAYPANPAIDGSVPAAGTLIVPAGWTGTITRETGLVQDGGWRFGQSRLSTPYWNGSELTWTVTQDVMLDTLSYYPGAAGLNITGASITIQSSDASTTAKVALFSAPTSRPVSNAAITRLATVAAPVLPTSGAVTFALPAAWLPQLASGAANAIGMIDETRSTTAEYVASKSAAIPNLSINYA